MGWHCPEMPNYMRNRTHVHIILLVRAHAPIWLNIFGYHKFLPRTFVVSCSLLLFWFDYSTTQAWALAWPCVWQNHHPNVLFEISLNRGSKLQVITNRSEHEPKNMLYHAFPCHIMPSHDRPCRPGHPMSAQECPYTTWIWLSFLGFFL